MWSSRGSSGTQIGNELNEIGDQNIYRYVV